MTVTASDEELAGIKSKMQQLATELGQTVVMVTHDPAAASYADSVLLLADGRIAGTIEQPTPEAVLTGLEALRTIDGIVA